MVNNQASELKRDLSLINKRYQAVLSPAGFKEQGSSEEHGEGATKVVRTALKSIQGHGSP